MSNTISFVKLPDSNRLPSSDAHAHILPQTRNFGKKRT